MEVYGMTKKAQPGFIKNFLDNYAIEKDKMLRAIKKLITGGADKVIPVDALNGQKNFRGRRIRQQLAGIQ